MSEPTIKYDPQFYRDIQLLKEPIFHTDYKFYPEPLVHQMSQFNKEPHYYPDPNSHQEPLFCSNPKLCPKSQVHPNIPFHSDPQYYIEPLFQTHQNDNNLAVQYKKSPKSRYCGVTAEQILLEDFPLQGPIDLSGGCCHEDCFCLDVLFNSNDQVFQEKYKDKYLNKISLQKTPSISRILGKSKCNTDNPENLESAAAKRSKIELENKEPADINCDVAEMKPVKDQQLFKILKKVRDAEKRKKFTNRYPKMQCKFCKNNGERPDVYTKHQLIVDGITVCPLLRHYTCHLCGQTGDNAHTLRHCPLYTHKLDLAYQATFLFE